MDNQELRELLEEILMAQAEAERRLANLEFYLTHKHHQEAPQQPRHDAASA